jgi:lipopolysaccharide transport system ATP-binding protein
LIRDIFGDYVYGTDTGLLKMKISTISGQKLSVNLRIPCYLGFGTYYLSLVVYCGDLFCRKDYYHWLDNAVKFLVSGNVGEPYFGYVKLCTEIHIDS